MILFEIILFEMILFEKKSMGFERKRRSVPLIQAIQAISGDLFC